MTLDASHAVVAAVAAAAAAVAVVHLDEAQQTLLHLPVYICPDLVYNANPGIRPQLPCLQPLTWHFDTLLRVFCLWDLNCGIKRFLADTISLG